MSSALINFSRDIRGAYGIRRLLGIKGWMVQDEPSEDIGLEQLWQGALNL